MQKLFSKIILLLSVVTILTFGADTIYAAAPNIDSILISVLGSPTISPQKAWVDVPFEMKIFGNGFVKDSMVAIYYPNNPTPSTRLATYNSDKQLVWNSGTGFPAGNYEVAIYSPPFPGGEVSNSKEFIIVYPAPVVTLLSPSQGIVGEPISFLKVEGSNFYEESVAIVSGEERETELVVPQNNQIVPYLKIKMSPNDFKIGSILFISVSNPDPGGGKSQPQKFIVRVPIATFTRIYPESVLIGSPDIELEINGTGFIENITQLWEADTTNNPIWIGPSPDQDDNWKIKEIKVISPTKIKFIFPASEHISKKSFTYIIENKGADNPHNIDEYAQRFKVLDPNADGTISIFRDHDILDTNLANNTKLVNYSISGLRGGLFSTQVEFGESTVSVPADIYSIEAMLPFNKGFILKEIVCDDDDGHSAAYPALTIDNVRVLANQRTDCSFFYDAVGSLNNNADEQDVGFLLIFPKAQASLKGAIYRNGDESVDSLLMVSGWLAKAKEGMIRLLSWN